VDLLYFTLASYGITLILVYGKIFEKIRPEHHFFHCPMCMGFWVGAFLFGINGFTELFNFEYNFANFLILGGISSGVSYIMTMLFDDFGVKVNIIQGGENG
tara:strand:+ start:4361 stop:4663 length:303 start_codon:yes stop_codon:yes gene_type:complete